MTTAFSSATAAWHCRCASAQPQPPIDTVLEEGLETFASHGYLTHDAALLLYARAIDRAEAQQYPLPHMPKSVWLAFDALSFGGSLSFEDAAPRVLSSEKWQKVQSIFETQKQAAPLFHS